MSFISCPFCCNYQYSAPNRELDELTYDKISNETLDELASFFEDLSDRGVCHPDYDVQFSVSKVIYRAG